MPEHILPSPPSCLLPPPFLRALCVSVVTLSPPLAPCLLPFPPCVDFSPISVLPSPSIPSSVSPPIPSSYKVINPKK